MEPIEEKDVTKEIQKWYDDKISCPYCNQILCDTDDWIMEYHKDDFEDIEVECDSCGAKFNLERRVEIERTASFIINEICAGPSTECCKQIVYKSGEPIHGLRVSWDHTIGKLVDPEAYLDYGKKYFRELTDPFDFELPILRYFETNDLIIQVGNSSYSHRLLQNIIGENFPLSEPGISVKITVQNSKTPDQPLKIIRVNGKDIEHQFILATHIGKK